MWAKLHAHRFFENRTLAVLRKIALQVHCNPVYKLLLILVRDCIKSIRRIGYRHADGWIRFFWPRQKPHEIILGPRRPRPPDRRSNAYLAIVHGDCRIEVDSRKGFFCLAIPAAGCSTFFLDGLSRTSARFEEDQCQQDGAETFQ